jgi:16S rRNA (cytosine1402-N4)-methyltransferase
MPMDVPDEGSNRPARPSDPDLATIRHVPVLLDRVLELLAPALADHPAVLVDATIGLGGHAEALLSAHPQLTVIGLDRDPAALGRSGERLDRFQARLHLVHTVYDRLADVLTDLGHPLVDGVLFDLGVSSLQLDDVQRGFSYASDTGLDMRMDPGGGHSAEQILNEYPVAELARVLRDYGEERFAQRIAQAIVRARTQERITSSARLAELVRNAIPAATRRTGGHPAKRTFQALRIEVNDELGALRRALPAAVSALLVHGRIVVLSYHSLEDRLVKQQLAELARDSTPVELPVLLADRGPQLRLLARGEGPGSAEVMANPRSASVRLRAAERVRAAS